jgi:nucleoside-diphosphate-sugar epimerase
MKAYRTREILEINARGVENVVGGAVDAGVRSIVYVSSIGALFVPDGPPLTADSPVVPSANPYAKSKSDAELYVRRLQEQGAPIHTTYPGAVVGPYDPGLSESNHALRTLARDVVLYTSGGFQMVDVRDLAAIHVKLAERPGASGRSIAVAPYLTWREFAEVLESVTGARGLRLVVPGALVRLGGRIGDAIKRVWDFDFPMTKEGMVFATRFKGADGSMTAQELGVRYRPAEETLADTLRWMHGAGLIPDRAVGRLARD